MKISHIALRLKSREEVDAAGAYYTDTYGLQEIGRRDRPGRYTIDLTDGNIAFALTYFDGGPADTEAEAAGPGSRIHHIGFDVDDFEARAQSVKEAGYEIFEVPGAVPFKYRAPGGTMVEFAPAPYFTDRTKVD